MTTDLADRYGTPAQWRRPVAIGLTTALAVACLSWLAWVAFYHGSPSVSSSLMTFDVTGTNEVRARVEVRFGESGVDATCRVRALAEDKTAVGELAFTPSEGVNDVVIRTERRATSVEKLGCTTEGQPRPR